MRYSIIFLDYDPDEINKKTSLDSLASIFKNSIGYDWELFHIKDVLGFASAVNDGLKKATGDYLVVVANDVVIKDPEWLGKLTFDDAISGWRLTPFHMTGQPRPDFACWCISRKIYEQVGGMDESFSEGYGYDDDDYVFRIREAGFGVEDAHVDLIHLECLTYNTVFGPEKEAMMMKNRLLYIEKHPA